MLRNLETKTPIVSLQSGNSLYLGKASNYPKVSNNLTAPFYGTFAKSSQTLFRMIANYYICIIRDVEKPLLPPKPNANELRKI